MDVRTVIRGIGKTLIAAGVLIFLFVAYQLWGTGLAEARDQSALKSKFNQQLGGAPTPVPGQALAPPVTAPAIPGDAIGLMEIPKIDVSKVIVEGVGTDDLKKAPGHYPGTPMPGEAGNSAIAGHRTTYGAPFNKLDELSAGDPIFVTTTLGKFRYEVDHSEIVGPDEVSVLDVTPDNRLTLTTCHPRFSAAQRLIVVARLVSPVVEAAPDPDPSPAPPVELASDVGLSGERADKTPAVLWGLLAALVAAAALLLGKSWKRWPVYIVATPIFLIVLFIFFENVSRLLPANV